MLKSKLPAIGTTIFTVMSKMAQDHNAINLSQGFPDFDCPPPLRERVSHYLNNKKNQYAPMSGVAELRQAIAEKVFIYYGYKADPETDITVTSGATEALFNAIQALVHPGDEVIVFDPAYDSYEPGINLAGGHAIHLPLSLPNYTIDWDQVKNTITAKTRLIIINSPHNPTGAILSPADMLALTEIVRDTNIYLLSDEVYEHMVFDGGRHESVLRYPELAAKSFAVFSFGKTYHATGWKLAYCVAPAALSAEFRKVHQYVTFTSTSFLQYAVADFMQACPQHTRELPGFYQQKRDTFIELMQDTAFQLTPSKGTYFQLADYSDISDKSDMDFCEWLTKEIGVAAIPLSPFYQNPPTTKHIRFCFCKNNSTLEQAASKLTKL
jgi:methionine aminotransferase